MSNDVDGAKGLYARLVRGRGKLTPPFFLPLVSWFLFTSNQLVRLACYRSEVLKANYCCCGFTI